MLSVRAGCHDLDFAIVAVPHPSSNAQLGGCALYKPTKADALHAPGHNVAASFKFIHEVKLFSTSRRQPSYLSEMAVVMACSSNSRKKTRIWLPDPRLA
jgi:hypothetical protein